MGVFVTGVLTGYLAGRAGKERIKRLPSVSNPFRSFTLPRIVPVIPEFKESATAFDPGQTLRLDG